MFNPFYYRFKFVKRYDQSQSSVIYIRIEDDNVKPCKIVNQNNSGTI